MINQLIKLLSHIGWRTKILVFSALYVFLVLVVGMFGAYAINQQKESMDSIVLGSQERVNIAANARLSVVEMGRALANVVSEVEKKEIRIQAVGAIRSLSKLEEQIQTLATNLPESEEVKQLSTLIKKMRPTQMQVIKFAKKNKDEEAMLKVRSLDDDSKLVNKISQHLVENERALLVSLLDRSKEQSNFVVTLMIWLIVVGLAVGVATSLFAAYMVTRPLNMLEEAMVKLASGKLNIVLDDAGTDEIGRTVSAMSATVKNLHEIISSIISGSEQLNSQSTNIGKTAETVNAVSTKLYAGIEAIKDDTQTVHTISDDVAERLRLTAESADITSDSTKESASQMLKTVADFQRFQKNMENTAEVTRNLSVAADQVTSITNTIHDISSQTNLLALNAAIEAARAGDQGRGFAVVADEVRQLAKRTEEATAEISTLVEEISTSVGSTVEALEKSVIDANDNIDKLTNLANETTQSSDRVQDMRSHMTEVEELMSMQTNAVNSISSSVNTLADVSIDANQETKQLHQLSQDLDSASLNLKQVVDRFTL